MEGEVVMEAWVVLAVGLPPGNGDTTDVVALVASGDEILPDLAEAPWPHASALPRPGGALRSRWAGLGLRKAHHQAPPQPPPGPEVFSLGLSFQTQ